MYLYSDETGFQIGVTGTANVITESKRFNRPFTGKVHQSTWYEINLVPYDLTTAVNENS